MSIMNISRTGLRDLFSENLAVKDADVHNHLVDLLDRQVDTTESPISKYCPDSVNITNLFSQGAIDELVRIGDYFCFLCGFFPEHFTGRKKKGIMRLGMGFYIEKGAEAYNYALSITIEQRGRPYSPDEKRIKPSLLSKLSDSIADNARAILMLRRNLLGREPVYNFSTMKEVRANLKYSPDLSSLLVKNGNYLNQEPLPAGHLKIVK